MQVNLSSLRGRVILGVAAVSLAVLSLFGVRATTEWQFRLDAVRERVQKTAELRATEQRDLIHRAAAVLTTLEQFDDVVAFSPSTGCAHLAARVARQSPYFTDVAIARPDGNIVCRGTAAPQVQGIGDRADFRKSLTTTTLVIGATTRDSPAGNFVLPLYRSVRDAHGTVLGVVTLGVDLAQINESHEFTRYPEGSSVGIVDGEGLVLARTPDVQRILGTSRAAAPVFQALKAAGGTGSADRVGFDGVARIYGFARLTETTAGPLTLWVGIPRDIVLAEVERHFVSPLLATLGLIVAMFAAALFGSDRLFVRPVLALTLTARRLATGDLATRVPPMNPRTELGQLGNALNTMAVALEADRRQLQRTHQALDQLDVALQRIPAVVAYVGRNERIQFANAAAAAWSGLAVESLCGQTMNVLCGGISPSHLRPHIDAALAGDSPRYELDFRDAQGLHRHVEVTHVPDLGPQGVTGFFFFANDVTRHRNEAASLARLAQLDPLCGLPNRRALADLLLQACKRADRERSWLTLLFVDIDDFKEINDSHGHAVGDAVLQHVATKLKAAVRAVDVVARYGGDEFIVLLEALQPPDAVRTVVAKIRAAFTLPVTLAARTLVLRASVGVAQAYGATATPEHLLAAADEDMYRVKATRKVHPP